MKTLPKGIYPALVTPFRGETFDAEGYSKNIQRWNSTGLAGYLALGSNGEGVLLTDDEAIRVVEAAQQNRSNGKALIAGTGRESTRRTIELTRRSARAGADAVLVVPPSYYRSAMSDAALEAHYNAVADASEVPVLLYHVPKFSPVNFTARLILALAKHPNIVGLKETSGDVTLFSAVLRERPDGFLLFMGTGSLLYTSFAQGCDGSICAIANVTPNECVQIWELVRQGKLREAQAIQWRIDPVNHLVTVAHGISGLKHAVNLLGYAGGNALRPLEPVGQKAAEEIRAALVTADLLAS